MSFPISDFQDRCPQPLGDASNTSTRETTCDAAEREGFEPPVDLWPTPAFEAGALNRSAISPWRPCPDLNRDYRLEGPVA